MALPPGVTALPAFATEPVPYDPTDIRPGGVMQVIAHQDDDLFFMNPDVNRSITAGLPSTTVYLTAGELSGDGESPEQRARNRQRGAQNAYAAMAGVADGDDTTQDEWAGDVLFAGDKQIERYRLRAVPRVQLLFVNLADFTLWTIDDGEDSQSVVPAAGLATTSVSYTRADVVTVLGTILSMYQPVLLRTQDPEPSPGIGPVPVPGWSSDHPDHTSGARFARAAAAQYPGDLYEVNYRDYDTADLPANLADADAVRKAAIIEQYYRYDQAFKESHRGDQWLSRQYYRWSRGTNWATSGPNGPLAVFEVRNGLVHQYQQPAAGRWGGPVRLADPGGRLAPGLAIGHDADGRLEIVARRLTDHHLVSLRQDSSGGSFQSVWSDLGSPSLTSDFADQVGTPAVALGGDGRLQIFVRNADGGVSVLVQDAPNGSWNSAAWTALPGEGVQDGLSAVTVAGGRIELYASTRTAVLRWRQQQPGGALALDATFPVDQPASPPHAIVDASGRVLVAYLAPTTGSVKLTRQVQADPDAWSAEPVSLASTGGTSEPAIAVSPGENGRVMLFARNGSSGVSVIVQEQQATGFGRWDDLGGVAFDQPAVAIDARGRVAVFAIGRSGVSVARVGVTGSSSYASDWHPLRDEDP